MKAVVFLNSAAGTLASQSNSSSPDSVLAALQAAGIEADLRSTRPAKLTETARQAAQEEGVDLVIAGGGDGTISAVASGLIGTEMPLGVLPLGTLNHFAKDLGIPMDLEEAVRIIADQHVGRVDVGTVNDRVFINNSSLGIYPRMVVDREDARSKLGISKWIAMVVAMLKVGWRFPLLKVKLTIDEETVIRKSPLVFVGNNCYQLDLFNLGKRACLNRGELCLYVANAQSRWAMFVLMLRAMTGRLKQARDFETYCLKSCTIETRRKRVHVAADGEVWKLVPPLNYRIQQAVLNICLPPEPPVNAEYPAEAVALYPPEHAPVNPRIG